jgi:hypothetical protein
MVMSGVHGFYDELECAGMIHLAGVALAIFKDSSGTGSIHLARATLAMHRVRDCLFFFTQKHEASGRGMGQLSAYRVHHTDHASTVRLSRIPSEHACSPSGHRWG